MQLHDIPRFSILFLGQLFFIFNQWLSIGAFGGREIYTDDILLVNQIGNFLVDFLLAGDFTAISSLYGFFKEPWRYGISESWGFQQGATEDDSDSWDVSIAVYVMYIERLKRVQNVIWTGQLLL